MDPDYYWENGEYIQSDHIERGSAIVYSEEEWRERRIGKHFRFHGFLYFLFFFCLGLPMIVGTTYGWFKFGEPTWLYLTLSLMAVVYYSLFATLVRKEYIESHLPPKGLYENGYQYIMNVFIPFSEMVSVGHIRDDERKDVLIIRLRGAKDNDLPIRIKGEFLGEDGIREIKMRVQVNSSKE